MVIIVLHSWLIYVKKSKKTINISDLEIISLQATSMFRLLRYFQILKQTK